MIVVDTSALVAIVRREAEAAAFAATLARVEQPVTPASAYLEAMMVLSNKPTGRAGLDAALNGFGIAIVPIDELVARRAADAFERYGKGRGHPAQLNFGDCMAYATAMTRGLPLLFKGGDFASTDVTPAS